MELDPKMINPEFWTDERVGRLPIWKRLLYLGLVSLEDDEGMVNASPRYLKTQLFPMRKEEISIDDIQNALDEMDKVKLIMRWKDDTTGKWYLAPLL